MTRILSRIGLISLCLTVLLFLWELPFFFLPGIINASSNLIHHAYVFAWMLALFWTRFAVSARTTLNSWFVGIYPSMLLAVLITLPLVTLPGVEGTSVHCLLVPFVEEAAKLLPVNLYLWCYSRKNRWQPSASDGLLLGWLVGAGFTIHEDAIKRILFAQGWSGSRYNPLLPTIIGSGGHFLAGHAVWTAFAGMATGFAFLYRKNRWARIVPVIVFVLVVLDHARVNAPGGNLFFVRWLRWILGDGELTIALFLGSIVAVFLIEGYLLAKWARRDWLCSAVSIKEAFKPGSFISRVRRFRNVVDYQRLRRAAHYRLWQWDGNLEFEPAGEMSAILFALAQKIGLHPENKCEEVLTMSIPADRKIYSGASTDSGSSVEAS